MEQNKLQKRLEYLYKQKTYIEKSMTDFPNGNLRIMKDKNNIKYFLITSKGDTHGKYIKKGEAETAHLIAKRDYYKKLHKEITHEIQAIERYLKSMNGSSAEDVYEKMNKYRQALVEPLMLSDQEYVKRWLEQEYLGNPYEVQDKRFETNRGDLVRTKSEAMIANVYYELGIPYRYEYPFRMHNGKIKYPDFTLLKMPERKMIYHEHMGLLEDKDYRQANLQKLYDYSKSGLLCTDNLILTFETDYIPLKISDIKKMISQIFNQ